MDLQQGSFLQGRFTKTISDTEIRSFPHKHIFDLLNRFSKGNASVQLNGNHSDGSSIPFYFVKEELSLYNPMCPNQSIGKFAGMEPKSYAEVTKGYGHSLHNEKIIKSLVSPFQAFFQQFCPKSEFNSFQRKDVSPVNNCYKSSYSCKVTPKSSRGVIKEPKEDSFSNKSFSNYKKMVPECPKTLSQKESMRGKSSHRNLRKSKSIPHNKQSLKREMGTKKQYPGKDMDGSVWARENSKYFVCEDKKPEVLPTPAVNSRSDEKPSSNLPSSESNCLEYICAPLPLKARTVSECSIDSDDSFIVFESNDNIDDIDPEENSSDDDCSSDDNDELDCCTFPLDSPPSYVLKAANLKWDTCYNDGQEHPKKNTKKKVSFAKDSDLAKVQTIVVWDYASRSARKGPWEQLARDSARFKERIKRTEDALSCVLDPAHRIKIFNERFNKQC